MTKKEDKKTLTVEDILKRKDFFKEKRTEKKTLYISSIDSNIVIQKPSRDLLFDVSDMDDESEADAYLVYESIVEPDLHSKEIQELYKEDITQPFDVLYEIFDSMEVTQIAQKIVAFGGLNGVSEVTEDLKK